MFHGNLAAEFFSILSVYFLIKAYYTKPSCMGALNYTKSRLKKLYPYYLFSFLVLFIFYYVIAGKYSGVGDIFKSIPEILLIQNIGIFKGAINTFLWYLSVLAFGGYFIYYAIVKNKDTFIKLIAPLIILFTYTARTNDDNNIENWDTK